MADDINLAIGMVSATVAIERAHDQRVLGDDWKMAVLAACGGWPIPRLTTCDRQRRDDLWRVV
jgi:hypothetical protein